MKRQGTPSIKAVTSILNDIWCDMRRGIKGDYTGTDSDAGVDVRLRVHRGYWDILTGSSDYDQDHRGYWGASFIGWNRQNLTDVARDLVDQVLDSIAMSDE